MTEGPRGPRERIDELGIALEQAYHRKSWHGATLRGALSRVGPEVAAWRPGKGRPSIREITVHCAYWKHSVLRRVATGEVEPFPEKGSDWFPRPEEPSEAGWREDLETLGRIHRSLREAVGELVDADLGKVPSGSKTSIGDLVRGVVFHDVHHGGQVQLIKRLWRLEHPS